MGRRVYDHKRFSEIQAFIDEGHGFAACHAKFGIAHATWVKAIERGDLHIGTRAGLNGDGRRIYDWAAVQRYYEQGHSFRDCQKQFGFSSGAWHDAKLRGEIHPRRAHMTIEEVLARGGSRKNVKLRLLGAGLLKDECNTCGITHWRGQKLNLHIDHINGSKNDHRLENLRMLCPNCHSQTPTYGGRNMKRRRRLQDDGPSV